MSPPARRTTSRVGTNRGFASSLARFWHNTYAPDYVGLTMLVVAYVLLETLAMPFHRMFRLDDTHLQYPHATVERVPLPWLFFYAGGIPIIVMLAWIFASRSGLHMVHVSLLGLFIGTLLTSFVTDIIKNAVGKPRPDLIARCKPMAGTPEHVFLNVPVCTELDQHVLHDGWRSFPSGHSSFAFSGLGFLAMFIAGQFHVFTPNGDLARGLIALAPLLAAAMIAISRFEDYRHDVYDITCGSVIGILIAQWSYRRFFPKLRSLQCDVPYPSRSDPKVIDDEENGIRSGMAIPLQEMDSGDEI